MTENQAIENIVQSLLTTYRKNVDVQNMDAVAVSLHYYRDFCYSVSMNYNNSDYTLVRLALLDYMKVR